VKDNVPRMNKEASSGVLLHIKVITVNNVVLKRWEEKIVNVLATKKW
jgi:hypothetical protein